MFVVDRQKDQVRSLPARRIGGKEIAALRSPLARRILRELSREQTYPKRLAQALKEHEQKVYYHIRKLEKAGLITVVRTELVQGSSANVFGLTSPALVYTLTPLEITQKIPGESAPSVEFLSPFIERGQLNALIIVGSPDPHGPEMARSRDGFYGMDLALFFGTYLNYLPSLNVKLDTEVTKEDLQRNLILIGGPAVNVITERVNGKLPIRFERAANWSIRSDCSGKSYFSDETGIVVKAKSPFNAKRHILLVAGKRYSGTRAVIIAFLRHFDKLAAPNRKGAVTAHVVEGVDKDADGVVDDAEILE